MGHVTKVEICFFKPTGYTDTYYVDTENRGLAIKTVMSRYNKELECINYITATASSQPKNERTILPNEVPIQI